jgi:hypothetical protein
LPLLVGRFFCVNDPFEEEVLTIVSRRLP